MTPTPTMSTAATCQHEFHYFGDQVSTRRCVKCDKLEPSDSALSTAVADTRNQFRKKPVVIEAIQWPGTKFDAPIPVWAREALNALPGSVGFMMRVGDEIIIDTLEGQMRASPGDWIIRGIKGELYPCKPDIFAATYDVAAPASDIAAAPEQQQDQALVDLMPKRAAFIAYCEARGYDTSVQKDDWGAQLFTGEGMLKMWEGWFNAPAVYATAPGSATAGVDVPDDLRFLLEYIPHTAARREAIRKVEALVASRRAAEVSPPDGAMPEQIAEVISHLIGEGIMDWKPSGSDWEAEAMNNDEERRALIAAVNKALTAQPAKSVDGAMPENLETFEGRLAYIRNHGDEALIQAVRTGQTPIHKAVEKITAARLAAQPAEESARQLPELIVTRNGVPVPDQAAGVRAFMAACASRPAEGSAQVATVSTFEHLHAAAKACDARGLPINADELRSLANDLFRNERPSRIAAPERSDTPTITDKNALGYRPPCCDGGGANSACCSYDRCAADRELEEMGIATPTAASKALDAAPAGLTREQVIELLLDGIIIECGARKLRNGDEMLFNLQELTYFANMARIDGDKQGAQVEGT